MRYFRVTVDPAIGTQWFPEEPVGEDGTVLDARLFTSCRPFSGSGVRLRTKQDGVMLPLNFGPFDIPVARRALAERIARLAPDDVQVVPATTDSGEACGIVNVLTCRDCIDELASVGTRWAPGDGRPDKVGQFRMITRLVVDAGKAGGAQVLRLTGWLTPLIVSEALLSNLDRRDLAGLALTVVTSGER